MALFTGLRRLARPKMTRAATKGQPNRLESFFLHDRSAICHALTHHLLDWKIIFRMFDLHLLEPMPAYPTSAIGSGRVISAFEN